MNCLQCTMWKMTMPRSALTTPQTLSGGAFDKGSALLSILRHENRALKPPGSVRDWHVGVRVASTKKLVAFIAGIPMELRIRQ